MRAASNNYRSMASHGSSQARAQALQYQRRGIAIVGGRDVPVLLRNLSATGACVRTVNGSDLPAEFMLRIHLERIEGRCEVMWQRGRDCGVRFRR